MRVVGLDVREELSDVGTTAVREEAFSFSGKVSADQLRELVECPSPELHSSLHSRSRRVDG